MLTETEVRAIASSFTKGVGWRGLVSARDAERRAVLAVRLPIRAEV